MTEKFPLSQDPITQSQARAIIAMRDGTLVEENARLRAENIELRFALQEAWPYVHAWCTIHSAKRKIETALFGSPRTSL